MRRVALVSVAALLLAGCGSTVQVKGTATAAGGSLGGTTPVTSTTGNGPVAQGTTGGPAAVPGGSGTSTGAVTGGSSTSSGQGVAPQAPGSRRVTAPIELGFMTTKVSNAQSFGLNVGSTYPEKDAVQAIVDEYNAAGGVGGRKILPVYGETDTASSDWETQFAAACQTLTQDHHVQAVLGYVFVFLDSFEKCLAGKGVTHLYGGYQPGDLQAQHDFPTIVSVAHPTVNLYDQTVLSGAIASGRLTGTSKLGIVYDTCAHGDRAFASTTEPFLKQHGIHYEAVQMSCAGGSGDVGSAAAAVKSAELQFASHGVDVVMMNNAIALLVFMENAESQGYRPSYVNAGMEGALEAQGSAIPQAQLKNLHGFGWMPAVDVAPNHQPYPQTPQQTACIAKLKKHGMTPSAYNDFMSAYVTCDAIELYARALNLTGGRSGQAEVKQALLQVIPQFHGAGTYSGADHVSPVQRGGAALYREIGWTDACSCFRYTGPVRAIQTS